MTLPILLLAAGLGTRMRGVDKLLEPVRGRALLRERAEMALEVSDRVIVALSDAPGRIAALDGLPVVQARVADPAAGMSVSLRAALGHVPDDARGALILLADMPDLTAGDLRSVIAAFEDAGGARITCGADGGRRGHPVIFPRRYLSALREETGDKGGRALIERHGAVAVALPEGHATTDLDTPEAWAAWRARG